MMIIAAQGTPLGAARPASATIGANASSAPVDRHGTLRPDGCTRVDTPGAAVRRRTCDVTAAPHGGIA